MNGVLGCNMEPFQMKFQPPSSAIWIVNRARSSNSYHLTLFGVITACPSRPAMRARRRIRWPENPSTESKIASVETQNISSSFQYALSAGSAPERTIVIGMTDLALFGLSLICPFIHVHGLPSAFSGMQEGQVWGPGGPVPLEPWAARPILTRPSVPASLASLRR